MAQFARCNWQWSRQFIASRNGVRSHNRLATLIRRRSLEGFKRIPEAWTQAVLRSTGGQVPWSARAAALGGFALRRWLRAAIELRYPGILGTGTALAVVAALLLLLTADLPPGVCPSSCPRPFWDTR